MRIFYSLSKIIFLGVLFCLFNIQANANVVVTMPTGGQNISTDKSVGGPSAGFTALGNVVIADNVAGDFTTGTGRTIILAAPAGWQFQAGVGTAVPTGPNLSVSGITITATAITITYTASGTAASGNSLTISGLQVQSTSKAVATAVNITRSGGTGVIAGFTTGSIVAQLSKVPGAFAKLQTLLPGENPAPGSVTGKTGTPSAQVAGNSFNFIVNAVDASWNVVTTAPSDLIQITSSDANALLPVNNLLSSGTQTFNVTLKTAGARNIVATNVTDGTKTAGTSANVTVGVGALTKLQLLLPGEVAAPGTPTGKTGTPTAITAGTAFIVTVNAVDANWNKVSSTDVINISSTGATNFTMPANSALAAGTKTYSVLLKTAGEIPILKATDVTNGARTPDVSQALTVNPGAFVKMQVLLPGETAAPGTATGKVINMVTTTVAGSPISVIVNAVDANWNRVTTVTDITSITSSDAFATLPGDAALVAGTQSFSVTLRAAGNRTITASDFSNSAKTANTSPNVVVTVGAFSKLQLILPGETAAPGATTGKTGTVSTRGSGVAFTVTVNAVDDNWNKITSVTDLVNVSMNDPLGTNPAANLALAAGTKNFSVNLRTIGTLYTITASDVTDGAKAAYTTDPVPVAAGTFTKLQILLPGETAAPFTTSGKTGTALPTTAGVPFSVIVNAVDANWNIVNTITDEVGVANTNAAYTTATTLPANTALVAGTQTFTVSFNRAVTQALRASDITNSTKTAITSASIAVNADVFSKLQILLPGETAAPGTPTGKTGTPTAQAAGVAFNAIVNAVDANWNKITSVTDVVGITSGNALDVMPANAALVAGTKTNFAITLRTVGTSTLTATDITDGTKTADISSPVTVNAGVFVKLQLLLPGEIAAPGTTTGKTGTPSTQIAGTPFTVTVNAVDAVWNVVNTATDIVKITSTDINATLPGNNALIAGTQTFDVTFKTAGSRTITATDVTNGAKTANTSPAVIVAPGAYSQLQVLLPGEIAAPGTLTGATGNPNIPARNTLFQIKISPVDAYYNIVSGVVNTINLTKSDAAATVPASSTLVNGAARSLNVTIRTAGPQTISITDASTSFNIVVTIPDPTVASISTDYFRTVDSGNWNDAASWESSTDGVNAWHAATLTPTNAAATITIRSPHVINVIANVTVDEVTVQLGGKVNVTAGTLTIANGSGDDFTVSGTLTNSSAITTTGTLVFNSSGTYQHNFSTTAGVIPTATWNAGSVCSVIGYTSFAAAVTGSGQTFSDFIWNCPDQNISGAGPNLLGTFTARDFTVISTGSGLLNLAATGGSATVSRNFSQIAGTVTLNKTSGTETLNIAGNVTLNGGTLQKGTGAGNIVFNGTTTQTYAKSGHTLAGAIDFTISSGSIVDFGTSVIDGTTGTFTLAAGGSIITANENGLAATGTNSGSIQNTGTRTYNIGNFTYNGTNDQLTGTGLPTTITDLIIVNATGVTLPATTATYTINGQLSINPTDGFLDMKTNALSGTFTNTGAGTLKTEAATAFAAGKTWIVGVEFSGAGSQDIIPGTYNKLLATSGSGSKTGPSGSLTVIGDWSTSGGQVNLLNTSVNFSGINQNIVDFGTNGGDGILFKNVTFSGGGTKTLTNGNFSIAENGVVTLSGSTVVNANGKLTLLSNATSSASVAAIPSGASITGAVKVQRYITGGAQNPYRTYRMLSSPVYDNTSTFINTNTPGNRSYKFSQFIDDMIVTGEGGAANGFDASTGNAPSAFSYNNGYVAVTDINTAINVGQGAYMFYRGDRVTNFTAKMTPPGYADPENIIMDFDGILNQQNITVNLTYSGATSGYNLVGNPYASTIDWNAGSWVKSNMIDAIRIWNPALRLYATYDGATGANGGSQYIPAGQSFFVQAQNAAGSLTFSEDVKAIAQPSTLLLSARSGGEVIAAAPKTELRVKLRKDAQVDGEETVVVLTAGKSSEFVQNEDIVHLRGEDIYLSSLSSDGKKLVINYMPEIESVTNVNLSVDAATTGNYKLDFNLNNVPSGYAVQLKDNYLNTLTNINTGTTYSLAIDKNVASTFGVNRFSLMVVPPVTLPVKITSFTANKATEGVIVKWVTSSETNNNHFELERAGENAVFTSLGQITAKGIGTYTFLDKNPLIGNNYYRLKQVDNDGTSNSFAQQAVVKYDLNAVNIAALSIFPNPVNDQFTIKFDGALTSAKQIVKIINATGQVLLTKTITKEELSNGYIVNVSGYSSGVYMVELADATTSKRVGLLKMIKL